MMKPEIFIFDVDGVMTDGKFYYTSEGKMMKKFGPDDNDALGLLDPFIKVQFITGDKKGFPITKKRIGIDMKRPIELVSTLQRIDWIKEHYDPKRVIYMGDGIFDSFVFSKVGYSIATANADTYAKSKAKYTNFPLPTFIIYEPMLLLFKIFKIIFKKSLICTKSLPG